MHDEDEEEVNVDLDGEEGLMEPLDDNDFGFEEEDPDKDH